MDGKRPEAAACIALDTTDLIARIAGREISLTRTEMRLLAILVELRGARATRERLLEAVWGLRHDPGTKIVEFHVCNLRHKLGPDARLIETVRGGGYRVAAPWVGVQRVPGGGGKHGNEV